MSKREKEIKTITTEFSVWEVKLQNLSSMNLFDAHNLSESSICELLNIIFEYKLRNLNELKMNFPAIDLGDKSNSLCIQVTSTKSSSKIQQTIDKFLKYNLDKDYEELFIIILGKKQIKYPKFNHPETFCFDPKNQILDFRDLLNLIQNKPIKKLEQISEILKNENIRENKGSKKLDNGARIKRNLALKKRLQRDFIRKLEKEEWEYSWYEPWIKFTYHNVLIRSVDDNKWPEVDDNPSGEISSWFKGEFWDFYENGIELITNGGQAIFDKDGNWDILDWKEDDRIKNKDYQPTNYWTYLRIPYDYIVEYDMETDPYHGIPSIYVRYEKDGMPYENILFGTYGSYRLKQHRYIFDENDRKKLL
tara:strand:- start:28679 stop:29767 length:1089 start_codon:yes stop_codon:yes gene_type:complete